MNPTPRDSLREAPQSKEFDCCVVGGGPAGMMAGYLLARAGIRTVVLEKHADFLRDFRGDTVHPSTLTVMEELDLLDGFLKLPHQKVDVLEARFGSRILRLGDFRRLNTRCPFIAFMPQWDFLNFMAVEARALERFTLMMRTEAFDLVHEGARVSGVRARSEAGEIEIRARLVIAADGRHSILRDRAGLPKLTIGAPIDVLWFRVPRDQSREDHVFANAASGKILITINRGDYWQCAFVIAKGAIDAIKARGLEAFRSDIGHAAPQLDPHLASLTDWDDIKLLTVEVDRLSEWSRPGLLCIGDSAHAMSPVGGVGINLAIQDAVAAANLLSGAFATDGPSPETLAAVQRRREWPTKVVQGFQVEVHKRVLAPVLGGANPKTEPPLPLRLLNSSPVLQGWAARFVGLGVRPEHVRQSGMFPT